MKTLIKATSDTKLRSFVLKAIPGTQVPYTQTHYFCIFQIFFIKKKNIKQGTKTNTIKHQKLD